MAKKTAATGMTAEERELAEKIDHCQKRMLELLRNLEEANNIFPVDMKEYEDIYFANALKQINDEKITEKAVRKSYDEAMESIRSLKNAYTSLKPRYFDDQMAVEMTIGRLSRAEDLLREVEVIRQEIQGIEFSNDNVKKNTKSAFAGLLQGLSNIVVFLRTNVDSALSSAKRLLIAGVKALEKFDPVAHLVKKTQIFSRKTKDKPVTPSRSSKVKPKRKRD